MESHFLLAFGLVILGISRAANGSIFTMVNNCGYTVWPGILSNAGSVKMATTGFELVPGATQSLQAPTGWSGRLWGRTGCHFDDSGRGSCRTGDCLSGAVECEGSGAEPPATLAEFTLGGAGGQDFYDVSLVDGYNLPMVVSVSGADRSSASGSCAMTGCTTDLNQRCPEELRVAGDSGDPVACRSACEAFGRPEFCCSGDFANPNTCKPSYYAGIFKSACPRAYSYAYDDATSTFTCANADYTIIFCPNFASQKSSMDATSSWSSSSSSSTSNPRATTGVILSDEGWLASLATADASSIRVAPWRGFAYYNAVASIVTVVGMIL